MPIDYNSFIAGVQTAMRLGREPPRIPTPVPSGRYILTENKRKIYTEKVWSKDVTLFYPGEWIELNDGRQYCFLFIDWPYHFELDYIPQNQYDGVIFCAKYYPSLWLDYYDYNMFASLHHEKHSVFYGYYDENGNPKYVSGISGTELVLTVLNQTGLQPKQHKSLTDYDRSSEYWTGWILAYYQWYSGKSFETILKYLPAQEINKMYNPLHEAPEQKFIEIANKIIFEKAKSSRLQELRKMAGLTQKKLADLSGVNLRTLQQYENQSKDINKASANTLLSLCKVLACDVEDICM